MLLRVVGSIITTAAVVLILVNLGLMAAVSFETLRSTSISLASSIYVVSLTFIGIALAGVIVGQGCHVLADYATGLKHE